MLIHVSKRGHWTVKNSSFCPKYVIIYIVTGTYYFWTNYITFRVIIGNNTPAFH